MEHKKGTRKLAKVFAEFKFRRIGKHFMETRNYFEIPLCKIRQRYETNGEIKQMETYTRS
jgi:hypothetical protein